MRREPAPKILVILFVLSISAWIWWMALAVEDLCRAF